MGHLMYQKIRNMLQGLGHLITCNDMPFRVEPSVFSWMFQPHCLVFVSDWLESLTNLYQYLGFYQHHYIKKVLKLRLWISNFQGKFKRLTALNSFEMVDDKDKVSLLFLKITWSIFQMKVLNRLFKLWYWFSIVYNAML